MCSYSALDGVPMCGNRRMLTDTLRTEWGFTGWVVSDCGAISNIVTQHKFVDNVTAAAALALTAGCDLECGSAYQSLPAAISAGLASEANVDTALYRSMTQQFKLGVFDPPGLNPYDAVPPTEVDTAAHRQLARDAAGQSAVLLANEARLLPLDLSTLRRIAVIGPSANDTAGYERCWDAGSGGCLYSHIYRGYSSFITTPLMGVQAAVSDVGSSAEVVYAEGCSSSFPNGRCSNPSGIVAAAALAKTADVAIVVVGLDESYEEEGTDRLDASTSGGGNGLFQLPGHQQQLIDAVVATGTRVVQVLINGGPLSVLPPTNGALLESFYGAQACGDGIADVLFGRVAPSGKMPITAYATPEQAGNITDMDMTHGLGRTYRYLQAEPTYPFGCVVTCFCVR
jgi:beta-glucosidase